MADDRLDDAIDAVVRAVDRIERATRGQRVIDAADPAGIADAEIERELRPPASGVAPGRDAWEPDPEAPVVGVRKKDKGKKKKRLAAEAAPAPAPAPIEPESLATEPEDVLPEVADERSLAASPAAAAVPVAPTIPGSGAHAPAEVHELVGRIVARTQELDDQLEAARRLRGEITELVARLAAAATHQR